MYPSTYFIVPGLFQITNLTLNRSSLLHCDDRVMGLPMWVAMFVDMIATWKIAAVMVISLGIERKELDDTANCSLRTTTETT